MSARFEFDQGAIDRLARDVTREAQRDLQRMFDDLGRRYKGSPVLTVKAALRDAVRRGGGDITEPELTEWAPHISQGTQIVLKS